MEYKTERDAEQMVNIAGLLGVMELPDVDVGTEEVGTVCNVTTH